MRNRTFGLGGCGTCRTARERRFQTRRALPRRRVYRAIITREGVLWLHAAFYCAAPSGSALTCGIRGGRHRAALRAARAARAGCGRSPSSGMACARTTRPEAHAANDVRKHCRDCPTPGTVGRRSTRHSTFSSSSSSVFLSFFVALSSSLPMVASRKTPAHHAEVATMWDVSTRSGRRASVATAAGHAYDHATLRHCTLLCHAPFPPCLFCM